MRFRRRVGLTQRLKDALPLSTFSVPATPSTRIGPPSLLMVSGPLICRALTRPPPEFTMAAFTPWTITGPPLEETVAVTWAGVVTVNATSQPESAHAGSARVRCPPDTLHTQRPGAATVRMAGPP